jgi:hypothetical protein
MQGPPFTFTTVNCGMVKSRGFFVLRKMLQLSSDKSYHTKKNDRRNTYKRKSEARSRSHCCSEKPKNLINIMNVCLYSSLTYPICKSYIFCAALYCHLWSVWLYHIFRHYLINGTIFRKKKHWTQNLFWFCLQLLRETFLILRRIQRDINIKVHRCSCKVNVTYFQNLLKLESFR